METNDHAPDPDAFDAFSKTEREKEIEDAAATKIMYLLSSQHYNVLYGKAYRGEDDRIINLIDHCETTGIRIREATDVDSLPFIVGIIDANLIQEMPANELRRLCREILDRDEKLINYMPQLKARLAKICRSMDMNEMLQPSVLSEIIRDVDAKKLLLSGHG